MLYRIQIYIATDVELPYKTLMPRRSSSELKLRKPILRIPILSNSNFTEFQF